VLFMSKQLPLLITAAGSLSVDAELARWYPSGPTARPALR
jgi:putative oxidoreductase